MIIDIRQFFGEIPKVNSRLLADGYAEQADNCRLESGKLQAMNGVLSIKDAQPDSETIYKMQSEFLEWNSNVDVVKALVADSGDRIFYTGDGYPKDTNATLALSGASPYPAGSRRLGIPAPTAPLVVSLTGSAGTEIERSSSYIYTIVGKWEDGSEVESGPSTPTAVFEIYEGITPVLTGFTDATATGVYTTHFRIYRLNPGNSGAEYQYVDEMATTEISYTDLVTDDDLGEVLPSEIWAAPDENLDGLIATSHGLVFGFAGNTIYPSEVFIPYSFPPNYTLVTESDIVGFGYTGSMVVALTKTVPYLLYGSSPESLELQRLGYQQPCISSKSIVDVPGGVIYASPDGLFMINESGVGSNITRNLFSKKQWKDLSPVNLIGIYYDDAYFGFFEGTTDAFRLNLENGEYQPLTTENAVYGVHYSSVDDLMYLIQAKDTGREIVAWDSGDLVSYTWKSKEYTGFSDVFSAGMVDSDFSEGPVYFNLYVDGVIVMTSSILSNDIFLIPPIYGNVFQVKVTGKSQVNRIIIAQAYEDIVGELLNG